MWALKPMFDDAERNFPFDMWMPVNPEIAVQYYIGYAFQLITICISAYIYFGVDSVTFSAVIFGCAQLDIIKEKIMSITPVYDRQRSEAEEIQSKNYEKLVDCIKHHQAVVKFTDLVENTYHSYLMFQLVGSVGIICMSALRIIVSEDLHTVMYKCVWYEQNLKFKRDLYFAMMRLSRPLVLRAGLYLRLSRQSFVAILRMSYSYFAVLNQTK
ncbi:unnamed protein product [Arctia plantaginis]|uniref:Uncharacterized protein n=1 Tax=Arctia plantaginis TaxID=874455 RepID=A0A8S1AHJ0_ARCPL|nr:unnamed protein product [Arctia plantaginis]